MNFPIILIVFGVIFIAELPDKSLIASLVLSQRYRKSYVWCGAAVAFLVHVTIAVTAGRLLTLLPHKIVETIVALLFFGGSMLLFFGKQEAESEEDLEALKAKRLSHSFLKAFSTSFVVVFLGEWGDITQITTANYAAKYHDTLSVAIGAVLGLWAVTAFGIVAGGKVLEHIPAKTVQRVTGAILLIFAIVSVVSIVK